MKVLIIFAHPNPMSFTKAILDNFVEGLKEAGHQYEILDLYKEKFNPIFQDMDFAFFVDKDITKRPFSADEPERNDYQTGRWTNKAVYSKMVYKEQDR